MKTNLFFMLLALVIFAFSATPAIASPKYGNKYYSNQPRFNVFSGSKPFGGGIRHSKPWKKPRSSYRPCPQTVHYYQPRPNYYSNYSRPNYYSHSNRPHPNSIAINLGSLLRR